MRRFAIAILACGMLGGCHPDAADIDAPGRAGHGRYAGVGIYETGRLWAHMVVPDTKQPVSAAKLADDEHVIVVVDSVTGEVRQCGDHSGYCISIAPWKAAGTATPTLPAQLSAHARDLDAADKSVAK